MSALKYNLYISGLVHMYYIDEIIELLGFQTMLILNLQFMVFDAVIVFDAE